MLNIGLSLGGFGVAHNYISGAVAYGIAYKLAHLELVVPSIIQNWYDTLLLNGGTIDNSSLAAASGLYSGLQISSYKDKIKYVLPMLGSNLSGVLTPLINTITTGASPKNVNFTTSDFTLAGGLQGNGSNKRLDLGFKPNQIGAGNNGGLGYWETNIAAKTNDTNVEPIGCYSSDNASRFCIDLRSTSAGFMWGAAANGIFSGIQTNTHFYGQRSGATVRDWFRTGIYQRSNTTSDSAAGAGDRNIYLLAINYGGSDSYWPGRCGFAYLTDGTLSVAEASGFHTLIQDTVMAPLGRITSPWEQAVTAAAGFLDSASRTIGLTLLQQIQTKTYRDKIKYFLPLLGTGIFEAFTPLINTFGTGRPINSNFSNADFTLTGGLKGNGTDKALNLNITPAQLGVSGQGGLGYIENDIDFGGNGTEPIGCYGGVGGDRYVLDLRNVVTQFNFGQTVAGVFASEAGSASNGHVYGQRRGNHAGNKELYKTGHLIAVSTTEGNYSQNNANTIHLVGSHQGGGVACWKGRCAGAYLTDGTLTSDEILDWHNTLNTYLINPLGRNGMASATDVDAQLYFDNIAAAGSTIDNTARQAITAFVIGCKNDGIWDLLQDVGPLCGSSLSGALVKLKRVSGSWSYTNNNFVDADYTQTGGLVGNIAGSKYLKANTVGTDLTNNSTTIGVYDRNTQDGSVSGPHGCKLDSNNRIGLYNSYSDNKTYSNLYNEGNELASSSINGPIGLIMGTRPASNSHVIYRNGTGIASTSTVGGSLPAREIAFLGFNNNGTFTSISNHAFGFLFLGKGFNAASAAKLYTRVQELQVALGRGV